MSMRIWHATMLGSMEETWTFIMHQRPRQEARHWHLFGGMAPS